MTTTDETKITISKGNLTISSDNLVTDAMGIGEIRSNRGVPLGYTVTFDDDVEWDSDSLQGLVYLLKLLSPPLATPRLYIYLNTGYNDDQA